MSNEADQTRRWLIHASGAAILSGAAPAFSAQAAPAPGARADAESISPATITLADYVAKTLDRELPFEYLDHNLKAGNSLVGCWLHLVDDYPLRALEREGGDGSKGERTKWLKAKLSCPGDASADRAPGFAP